jgi:hypothetical protein
VTFRDRTAIVGIGETEYVRGSGRSAVELMIEAAQAAIADAGLAADVCDGVIPQQIYTVAEELALTLSNETLR